MFTGVSGSGKSSLVFDTIAAESQRSINETYTTFIQSFMPNLGQPDVDSLRNLSAAIVVDQERMGPAPGQRSAPPPTPTPCRASSSAVSASPTSARPTSSPSTIPRACARLVRASAGSRGSTSTAWSTGTCRSTRAPSPSPTFAVDSWYWQIFTRSGYFDNDKPLRDYSTAEWEQFLHGAEAKIPPVGATCLRGAGRQVPARLYLSKNLESMQPHVRAVVERVTTFGPCPACGAPGSTRRPSRQDRGPQHRRVLGHPGE